jgi:DNA-directed RNA polymerase II subunit RPB2
MEESAVWSIIDSYFKNNPNCLVSHHLDSYNDFFKNGIFQIFRERGPIELSSNFDESTGEFKNKCILHLGGKDGKRIYFGKPVIYDDKNSHYMFPNEARLRNMTYGMTIHYDIEVEYVNTLSPGEKPTIVGEEIIEKHGGLSYKEYEEKESDYTHEINRPFRNVKDIADDDVAELHDGQDGGARKKQEGTQKKEDKRKKVTRSKRTIKPFQMTPGIAAALREATEKSMISPNTQSRTQMLSNIYLGKFPIMLQSEFCVLHGLTPEIRHTMGECRSDVGGYFIIQGLEKTVIAQEKFADNMLWVRKGKDTVDDDGEVISATEYLYSADIRSVSENVSKPIRNLSVQILADSETSKKNIVVNVPNVRKPVPLFILFRALGILSDKDIIQMCLLDMNKYEHMLDLFAPSVHDAGAIMTQSAALKYIASLTKGKRKENAMEILSDYFLPHIGEVNFSEKAYYLGHMVFKLLSVYTGLELPTDRDNFKYKRLELVGSLMYDLFREYYNLQWKNIQVELEKRLYYNNNLYANNLPNLIQTFYEEIFKNRIVETGFKKAFKGNWGSQTNTKRIGVVQDINRLSFNSFMSHLRKTNLPMDAGSKLVEPRKLHCSQWGFIDPIDTPDGGNIGLHKSLAIATHVTRGGSGLRGPIVQWLREKISLKYVDECSPQVLAEMTKIMVNGYWAGSIMDPFDCINKIKLFRRNALLPIYMSVTFEIKTNSIYIYTDAGRLSRPIFYKDDMTQKLSFEHSTIEQKIKDRDFDWMDLICGFNKKREEAAFHPDNQRIYELFELYEGLNNETNPTKLERFLNKKAIIDYIDCSESENALIAVNPEEYQQHKAKNFTHLEIHESLIFGNMCNLIAFPENNPPTRNSFSCGQSKQAVSLYHTNYQMRMDKTAVVLNSGQTPLIKTRYLNYINHEENPYGENVIVAIMCYTGYNVEDAVLINEGSLKRGLFRTTYYTSYQSHEESSKSGDVVTDIKFANIESESDVVGTKPGYDYSKLDKYGLIREGTEVDDKTVLIGLTSSMSGVNKKIDGSKTPKKGQLGIVDKTFITEGEAGERIAKVRIREERIPNLGDKLASRTGQKGTVGMIIPESNMPFTRDGIRPDMIINPHAIPSRMTIGQLVECIVGKVCLMAGGFGDCTAFINKGSKVRLFGEFLTKIGHNPSKTDTENLLKNGYHSSGNEIFYNGMTGEQIEGEIFVGPTYYMRLKHMVKDKINYRALGPRTALTKQPVSGRANDGGLRIGEMERDSVASHGIVDFLTESMMERGDRYYMAVCNMTGLLAVYNPSKNLFMSPMADGPLKFVGSLDGKEMHIENITRFGRSFSVISVPYSFKLLIQELQTINIQMRIITEDNIQQLENMTFSKNIEKLMQLEEEPTHLKKLEMVKAATTRAIKESKIGDDADEWNSKYGNILTPSPPSEAIGSPEYMETTPEYESPGSNAASPYHPPTPEGSPSAATAAAGGAPTYELDELVHLRGDPEAPRLWKVVDIGPNTVTINLHNTAGNDPVLMPMDRNEIKVVQKHDLIKLDEMVYAGRPDSNVVLPPPGAPDMELPVILPGQMMSQGQPVGADVPANIHFAPVINVVGRDNTGVIDFPDTENQGIPPPTMMTIGGSNNDPSLPSVLSPPPLGTKPSLDNTAAWTEEQTNHSFTDGKLNFENLVIKKI